MDVKSLPVFELTVEAFLSGHRIDVFLSRHLRNYTTWRLQRIAAAGGVTINSVPVDEVTRVFEGQQVCVRLIEPPDKLLEPEQLSLPVIYEDHWLMVVNKPPDVVVHPVGTVQSGTLCNGVQHLLDQRTEYKGLLRPGIVHRLDRQTSGAIVVALTHVAHVGLSEAFETSRVSKTYLALVEGQIEKDQGVIDRPIGKLPTGRHVLMSCRPDAIQAKPAKTSYRVLERFTDHTLVLCKPVTGRNHQIRVHLAHLGYPIVGDEFYERNGRVKPFHNKANGNHSREVETGFPIRRHALHAYQLSFSHPITQRWMSHLAPLPGDFLATLQVLGSEHFSERNSSALPANEVHDESELD
ncbi:RluA family pseudouridine synthase [Thalassoglobus sp. JC818]|uniref:RluA family pseudouridine synthase n=1 Tax=Thalassoglobus sp. JC818 TaxID=3232136 RepID=UPI0034574A5D